LSVREINGIGETRAGLLAAHDVRTLSEFVRLSDDRIAAILSVSVERAREFLVDARRRMERP
jgi:hypothetical protein